MKKNIIHEFNAEPIKQSRIVFFIPFLYDPVAKKPSITITFAFCTFVLSLISVIVIHFKPSLIPVTLLTIGFWVISVVFYLIRKVTNAHIDLKNRSIDLQNNSNRSK